jgi:ankyrin repeat protein
MMEWLMRQGLNVYATDSMGHTLLITAATEGNKAAAEWLLQQGVAVNAVASGGVTALHRASSSKYGDDAAMVQLLLANGADVHKCTDSQLTALDWAALQGNLNCARVLIAAGIDVNHFNSLNMTCLHTAIVTHRSAELVQLLLNHGATAVMNSVIHKSCKTGARCCTTTTALMMCTEADTVKLLLAAGADVHVTNEAGDTCLHVAAKHNWKAPLMCLLIRAGADLHAVDNEGKTATQLAHDKGHTLIEQLLNRAAQQA